MLGPKHTTRFSAAAVAVAGSLSLGFAAEDILWTWDTPDLLGSWGTAWGQAQTIQDPWEDNTGNNGGSLYISTDYRGPLPEENRNVITVMGNHGPWLWNGEVRINLVEYERLEFDIKWDTASATLTLEQFNTAGGDNGLVLWSASIPKAVPALIPPSSTSSGSFAESSATRCSKANGSRYSRPN